MHVNICGGMLTVWSVYHPLQLKQDDLWAKWMDVAFSKLDSNGDGYISLDEIVSTVPGSDDAGDVDNRLIAVSQASRRSLTSLSPRQLQCDRVHAADVVSDLMMSDRRGLNACQRGHPSCLGLEYVPDPCCCLCIRCRC